MTKRLVREVQCGGIVQLGVMVGLWLVCAAAACGQESAPGGELTVEKVDGYLAKVDGEEGLSEEIGGRLKELYEEARSELVAAQASRDEAAGYRGVLDSAEAELAKTFQERDEIEKAIEAGVLASSGEKELPPEGLQSLLREEEARLGEAEKELGEVNGEMAELAERPAEIPGEVARLRGELSTLEDEMAGAQAGGDPLNAVTAEQVRNQARADALQARLDALEAERASVPTRAELAKAEKEMLEEKVSYQTARVAALRGVARQSAAGVASETEKAAEVARKAGEGDLAAELEDAVEELRTSSGDLISVEAKLEGYRTRLSELELEFSHVTRQVKANEGEGVSSQALIDQQQALPEPRMIKRELRQEKSALSRVRIERLNVERELSRLAEGDELSEGEAALRKALEELERVYSRLVLQHGDLQMVGQRYLSTVERFDAFLREKLFWVRSSPGLDLETLKGVPEGIDWLAGPTRWQELVSGFTSTLHQNSIRFGLLATLAVVLLLARPRFRKRMDSHRDDIRKVTSDRYRHTLEALGIILLISIPFSLIMWMLGRQLLYNPDASEWTQGLAQGVMTMAPVLFAFVLVREICRPEGLADAHLRIRRSTLDRLRRGVSAIGWVYVPAGVILAMVFAERSGHHVHTIGRLVFMIAMLWVAFWQVRMFHPAKGAFAEQIERSPERMYARLRWLWFPLLVLVPLFLAGLAAVGYFVTALTLNGYLQASGGIIVGCILLYALILRWFRIRERKLTLERILAERQARREAAEAAGEEVCAGEEGGVVEEEQLDLAQVGLQTRRLLRALVVSGAIALLWFVWAGALPVLKSLDSQSLIGEASVADVILGIVIVVATVIVAKNLPGILEIAVLQNLPLDNGSRYAISSLAQYVIIAVGGLLAFNMLSFDWSKLGWAVAALSVGLGFGLQEIVANFVCGIILLFERPIRVGDIVTVSNVTGSVTRIRMRATTITDWDRKEFVVPNKEFITGQLLNWTLSNTTNRIVIKVGVAYGTDTDKVRDILHDVLVQHEDILEDPAPIVTFENFGDSSLDFVVRCYLPNLDRRIMVTHELYSTIHRRFLDEGIEIPFPQRDLHLRSDSTK